MHITPKQLWSSRWKQKCGVTFTDIVSEKCLYFRLNWNIWFLINILIRTWFQHVHIIGWVLWGLVLIKGLKKGTFTWRVDQCGFYAQLTPTLLGDSRAGISTTDRIWVQGFRVRVTVGTRAVEIASSQILFGFPWAWYIYPGWWWLPLEASQFWIEIQNTRALDHWLPVCSGYVITVVWEVLCGLFSQLDTTCTCIWLVEAPHVGL